MTAPDPVDQITSDLSSELLDDIRKYVDLPDVKQKIRKVHRSEFLPHMFRLRGQPFSLADRGQFNVMYDNEYVPETIFLCGRQTGKSINLSRSEIMDCLSVPEIQLLYVAPLQQQTQRYSTLYLNEAIQSCELARKLQSKDLEGKLSDSKILQTVSHQSFANGAGIQLTYAKTSPDRARGIFADRIDFDEIQDQLVDNIPVIAESLTSSKWGVRKYTGTAKSVDNTIEYLFQKSSKCEWLMKCEGCGRFNIPNMEGKVLDMIQNDGLHCVYCGKRLNAREGQWVAARPDRMDDFRGYHIPQVVLPAFCDNPSYWSKILRKRKTLPEPIFIQEALGISYSTGSRLISEQDILEHSTLPTMAELQKHLERYVLIVGGLDWGGAEQNSFTVHVVIGVRPDGRMDVIWARRFAGFDADDCMTEIAKTHHFYGCKVLAADEGMGFDKNVLLEKQYGVSVAQFKFCRQNTLLSRHEQRGKNVWMTDKSSALDILFMSIKRGRIFFPPQSDMDIYTKDLLSPYEQVSEVGGLTTRRYLRDPSQPDDFCMALCYGAMLAMKMMYGDSGVNMIPDTIGSGSILGQTPEQVRVDPADVLASMQ